MKRKFILSIAAAAFSLSVNAQDVHFSLFNFAPLTLNPAQAGVHSDVRAISNYRNQWSSVARGYRTMGIAGDVAAFKRAGVPAWAGAGVSVYNDKAGDGQLGTFKTDLSVSGCVQNDKHIFSGGMQFGYCQKSVNTGDFSWDSQFNGFEYDPTLSPMEYYNNPSFNFFTMGSGVNWYYSKTEHYMTATDELKVNMGISAFHFNGPKQSFKNLTGEKLYSKIILYGNYSIGLHKKRLCLVPSYMVSFQGPSREIVVGNLFRYIITEASHFTHIKKACAVSLGGSYRAGDAFLAQMVIEYEQYALGIAYDMNTSKLKTASKSFGGLEVNFRFHAFRTAGISKPRV